MPRFFALLFFNQINHQNIAAFSIAISCFLFIESAIELPRRSTIRTSGHSGSSRSVCHLPQIDPWDDSIKSYIYKAPPLNCSTVPVQFYIEQNDDQWGSLILKGQNLDRVQCRFCPVTRIDDFQIVFNQNWQEIKAFPFTDWPDEVDFIQISCQAKDGKEFTDIFSNIKRTSDADAELGKKWNIVMLGIDSMSRLNAIRQIPETLKKLHEHGGIILKGHNKVGENTFPNVVGMLTGERTEVDQGQPYPGALEHDGSTGRSYDNYPFIWKKFAQSGYKTMYAEDMPSIGTFQWQRAGFKQQPTDHYGRTMWVAMEKMKPLEALFDPLLLILENRKIHLTKHNSLCFNQRPKFVMQWNYAVKQMIKAHSGRVPFFIFSWLVELGHDHANDFQLADSELVRILDWYFENNFNKRTFFFLISDHGSRVDSIRNTLTGRIEDRLPFFSVIVPDEFKQEYPQFFKNLQVNSNRLTTHFDIYHTLQHILCLSNPSQCEAEGKGFFFKLSFFI